MLAPATAHGVQALDRAKVLLAAGLLAEAAEFTADAQKSFRANRAMLDLAEAHLVSSEIRLLAREAAVARTSARRAAAIYLTRGNVPATLTARLLELRADSLLRRKPSLTFDTAPSTSSQRATAARRASADAAKARHSQQNYRSPDWPTKQEPRS